MAGPKYPNVDASNSYRPVGEKVHGTIVMTGPVYPNVEGSNKVFSMNKKNRHLCKKVVLPFHYLSKKITAAAVFSKI